MNSGFPYLSSCDLTHVGNHRKRNEDTVLRLHDCGIFCIADGMGGLEAGKLASMRAVESLQQEFLPSPHLTSALKCSTKRSLVGRALNRASHWIKTHATANGLSAAGTTTVVLVFDRSTPEQAFILHAGDSRVYRFRANTIVRLTRDHTLAEAAGIEDEKSLPPIFRGVVTRAVGIESEVLLEETPVDVRADDIFLLCSDGLTRMVPEPYLENLLQKHGNSNLPVLANVLIDEALRAGGMDNVSVVLVRVGHDLPETLTSLAYETSEASVAASSFSKNNLEC